MISILDSLGRFFTGNLEYTLRVFLTIYLSIRATILDRSQGFRPIFSEISAQIYFTAWQALPLITVLALGTGSLLVFQSLSNLALVGGIQMIGPFLVAMIVREASPLLVALVVIARSGTAVASEVGNMKANREIEALMSMGINPLSFIVFPRVIGGIISTLCLAFIFNVVALFGGYILTRFIQDMPLAFYLDSILGAFAKEEIWMFLLKNGFSGMVIFVVSSYQGLSVKRSPHEVPQVTMQAVLNSIIFVILFNLIVTTVFYVNRIQQWGIV